MQSIGNICRLKSSNSHLRLLKFVSEVGVEVPSVELQAISTQRAFSKENPLRYHAISYTWGSRNPSSIIVNGQNFPVYESCRTALRRAQKYVEPSNSDQTHENAEFNYYWIDAICIDQNDHMEKANQVQLMGQIYDEAKLVLSYIGEEADSSNLWPGPDFGSRAFGWLREQPETDLENVSAALKLILEREYFNRVWILQEVFRKQSRTILLCGGRHVSFEALFALKRAFFYANQEGFHFDVVRWFFGAVGLVEGQFRAVGQQWARYEHPTQPASFLVDVSFPGQRFSNSTNGWTTEDGKDGLEEVLDMASDFGCSDARDKIYGTLQLVDWQSRAEIHPDYDKTRFELVLEVLTNGWSLDKYPDFAKVLRLPFIFRFFENSTRLNYFEETKAAIMERYQASATQSDQTPDMRCLHPRWKEVDMDKLISKQMLISLADTRVEGDTHALIASPDDGEKVENAPSLTLSKITPKSAKYSIVVFAKSSDGGELRITTVHLCQVSEAIPMDGQSFDLFLAPQDALMIAFVAASVMEGQVSDISSFLGDLGGLNHQCSSYARAPLS